MVPTPIARANEEAGRGGRRQALGPPDLAVGGLGTTTFDGDRPRSGESYGRRPRERRIDDEGPWSSGSTKGVRERRIRRARTSGVADQRWQKLAWEQWIW
ncbi:hypothetical protein E2562_026891 [Oryza meyeriana var. granulata]|uniref:Uncharacterized protein n=1 Tax=Oryza meyeriana var. granulata TaxID=110450 RepID=A0A6G1EPN3_9ORYZ|nr:hypothetical protein E2562_026891 [Oryza meyeriana var. granulata]